jgi:hypothetical protein
MVASMALGWMIAAGAGFALALLGAYRLYGDRLPPHCAAGTRRWPASSRRWP